jgi:hypothetical protein
MVVKQNPYDSANGHHVQNCGNAHLKDQVDQRLDSDDHQEREHGTEEKDGGGHAFAREARRACHIVEAEESSPREFEIGPAFCDIANVPGMTAAALRVFLTSSHPKMPNLALTPEETRM